MHKGGCLCGRIRYEVRGELSEISLCHCQQCRKAQGGAYVAVSPMRSADFVIVQGREFIKEYRSSPNKVRAFCGECGSPLYSARDDLPEMKRLRLGTLETPLHVADKYHIFVGSKADWEELDDGLPKYAEWKA